jgi:transcriptional regulator with XRE-family HTH domain
MNPARIVKQARRAAGLTQAQLARRLGTTQPEIARIESPRSNPRLATLNRAVAATGHRLELSLVPLEPPRIDETLLAANLRVPPGERLRRFGKAYRSVARLTRRARGAAWGS